MDSDGIFVSNIPDKTSKLDLHLTFLRQSAGLYDISYIIYPVEQDNSRAFIKFSEFPEKIFGSNCEIKGQRLTVTPAQTEVFTVCSAIVDTLVVTSIPDLRQFIDKLKDEFGLRVDYTSERQQLLLTGSLIQLQAAQTWLRGAFSRHRELQRTQLMKAMLSRSGKGELSDGKGDKPQAAAYQKRNNNGALSVYQHEHVGGETYESDYQHRHHHLHHHYPQRDEFGTDLNSSLAHRSSTTGPGSLDAATDRKNQATDGKIPFDARDVEATKTRGRQVSSCIGLRNVQYGRLDIGTISPQHLLQYHSIASSGDQPEGTTNASTKLDHQRDNVELSNQGEMVTSSLITGSEVDELQAMGDQSSPKTVADLDYYIVEYLMRCQQLQVRKIEAQFEVSIKKVGRVCDDIITLSFERVRLRSDVDGQEEKARDVFSNLVQQAYAYIIQKEIHLDFPVDEISFLSCQRVFKDVFVNANDDFSALTVVGPFENVTVAETVIRSDMKKRTSRSDSREVGYQNDTYQDNDDEFHFTCESARLCEAETGGKRPRASVAVRLYSADIVQLSVDVIVNAANSGLENWCGVAGDIEKAGGVQLREDCRRIIAVGGLLKPSEVVHTPRRGSLKCRDVLHTVGPMWNVHSDKKICTELLERTFENVLHYASHKLKATTIAIPPIGSGIFGVPLDVCARSIYKAIKAIVDNMSNLSLREIHLVSYDPDTTAYIQTVFRQLLDNDFNIASGQKHGDDDVVLRQFDKLEVDKRDGKFKVCERGMDLEEADEADEQSGDEENESWESMHDSLAGCDHGVQQEDQFQRSVSQTPTGPPVAGVVVEERARTQQPGVTVSSSSTAVAECRDEEELPGRSPQHSKETQVSAVSVDHSFRSLSHESSDESQLMSPGAISSNVDDAVAASRYHSYSSLTATSRSMVGDGSTTVRVGHVADDD